VPRDSRPSPLGLAVLSMLIPGPLHPYGIQRLLKLWGKDHVVNVEQRANLYKTIRRLHESGLIEVRQTERDHQYPERTLYELTADGVQQAREWLTDMLATVRNEFPQFPAALSFAMGLPPSELRAALEQRAAVLRKNLAEMEQALQALDGELPRVTLLDDDYLRAVTTAELTWIDGVLDELRTGALTWDREQLARLALQSVAPVAPDLTEEYISGYEQPPPGSSPS
jgi:DNA-binding PadR family transcriptional regulator